MLLVLRVRSLTDGQTFRHLDRQALMGYSHRFGDNAFWIGGTQCMEINFCKDVFQNIFVTIYSTQKAAFTDQ